MWDNTKQNEDYWRNRHIDWKHAYWTPEHPHRDFMINMLKVTPPKSVLEIGCGCGANLYRIKKEFPECHIAGCDINPDAVRTAMEVFKKEFPNAQFADKTTAWISDSEIDFRVGDVTAIPFHGEYYDLVLTDAMLIYIAPDKIKRALREIRRVGYEKMMFIEFHSESWLKRWGLRRASRNNAYNYFRLLSDNHFKHINITKLPKGTFEGEPWDTFGHIITSLR